MYCLRKGGLAPSLFFGGKEKHRHLASNLLLQIRVVVAVHDFITLRVFIDSFMLFWRQIARYVQE